MAELAAVQQTKAIAARGPDAKPGPVLRGEFNSDLQAWFEQQSAKELLEAERETLTKEYGSSLERKHISDLRQKGDPLSPSMKIRLLYIRRFMAEYAAPQLPSAAKKTAAAS